MSSKTPSEIVRALDRHIVGQEAAKRAVAVAVRNRWRRMRLSREIADEITPRNIVMIGPTGVGKTEIARRLAQLVEAPFIKVEATKFTEVGYVGRDVESMVRDLLETAIKMIREFDAREVASRAEDAARDRVVSLLLGEAIGDPVEQDDDDPSAGARAPGAEATHDRVRAKMRTKLDEGFFDDRELEIMVRERPTIPMMGGGNDQMEQGGRSCHGGGGTRGA